MSSTTLKLLEDALQLPETERADLAARLLESLDPETDADVQAAWDAELGRRLADLESGRVQPVPWPAAQARIFGRGHGKPDA